MEREDWQIEKARLLNAMGKMEAWTATLLQTIAEAKTEIAAADDDFMFRPESHPVGVAAFEMTMRDIDSSLREVLAVQQSIRERYRKNVVALDKGQLLEKLEVTPEQVSEVMTRIQSTLAGEKPEGRSSVVCLVTKDRIELQIEAEK